MNQIDIFKNQTDSIASSLNRMDADVDTIYAIGNALDSEYRQRFGKRFAIINFYEKAGLK